MYFENFLYLCESAGVKPSRAGLEAGISSATISQWKKGAYTPKTDKLQRLANYFDVPLSAITGQQNEEESPEVKPYYINEETERLAKCLFESQPLRLLVDAAKDVPPESLKVVRDLCQVLSTKQQ